MVASCTYTLTKCTLEAGLCEISFVVKDFFFLFTAVTLLAVTDLSRLTKNNKIFTFSYIAVKGFSI